MSPILGWWNARNVIRSGQGNRHFLSVEHVRGCEIVANSNNGHFGLSIQNGATLIVLLDATIAENKWVGVVM